MCDVYVLVAAGRCWQDRGYVSQSPTRTRSSLPSTSRGRMACCAMSPLSPGSRSSMLTRPSWQHAATTLGWVSTVQPTPPNPNPHRTHFDVLQLSSEPWGDLIPCIPHVARFDWHKGFGQAYTSIKSRYRSGGSAHCWYDGGDNALRNHLKGLLDCFQHVLCWTCSRIWRHNCF